MGFISFNFLGFDLSAASYELLSLKVLNQNTKSLIVENIVATSEFQDLRLKWESPCMCWVSARCQKLKWY